MSIREVVAMSAEAKDAARRLFMVNENLGKYVNSAKALGLDLKNLKNLKRTVTTAQEDLSKLKDLKRTVDSTETIVKATKKASDIATKVQEALFKNVPGSAVLDKASRIGGILGILAAIGSVALLKLQEFVGSAIFKNLDNINEELTKVNTIAVKNGLKLKTIDTKLQKISTDLDTNAKDYYQLNKKQDSLDKSISEAKKQSNDALYETRQGRRILESKIAESKKESNDALYETRQNKTALESQIVESKKQSNDALYETRQTKLNLDIKIQEVNKDITRIGGTITAVVQTAVNTATSKLQTEFATVKLDLAKIKPASPVDIAAINANAVAAAKAEASVALGQVSALQSVVSGLGLQTAAALTLGGTAINGISNLAQGVSTANNTASEALRESRSKGIPDLTPLQQQLDDKFNRFVTENNKALGIKDLQQSDLSKEYDRKNADFQRQSNLTSEQRFNEFVAGNNKALGIRDLQLSNLSKEFDKRNADFERKSNLTSEQRFEEFQRENRASLGLLESDLGAVKADLGATEVGIKQIDTKIREQEKVNATAIPKLDQILGFLPLIPGRAADAIRPDIATLPQIEAAAAAGTCRTAQPGGCMSKALDNNAANINSNTNNKTGNILDAVNTGANAALLAGQQTILQRLGNQLPGGIGGKLSRFADWMHLDRVLNVMILGATVHNAVMLSNDIGQTFVGIINNVLQLVGLKKEDGSTFDIGSVISSSIENLIKGAIGAENYASLTTGWAKANRIYQATTNILNSFQGLTSTVLSGVELVAGQTGKIGNALRASGEVIDSAYQWMNPQPKINRVTNFLEKLQNGASTIQQVTQVPLDTINAITELQTANTEFIKAIKEDDKPENKAPDVAQPDKLAADKVLAKEASKGLDLLDIDLEADDDITT